jgi:hypothetical protein
MIFWKVLKTINMKKSLILVKLAIFNIFTVFVNNSWNIAYLSYFRQILTNFIISIEVPKNRGQKC